MSSKPKNTNEKASEKSFSSPKSAESPSEGDLWDLDEEPESEVETSEVTLPHANLPSKRVKNSAVSSSTPEIREIVLSQPTSTTEGSETSEDTEPSKNPDSSERIEVAKKKEDFDELGELDDPIEESEEPNEEERQGQTSSDSQDPESEENQETPNSESEKTPEQHPKKPSSQTTGKTDSTDRNDKIILEVGSEKKSLNKKKNSESSLSKIEKFGIGTLILILAVSAILSVRHFADRIDLKPLIADEIDLPIKGKMALVTALETFWREPITTGENRDVVKRGVELIPVIKLDLERISGEASAIRILFRNDEGTVIGDNISRIIPANGTLEISATDGFDDLGMHAAYRTGNSSKWMIQILEGPSVQAPIEQFSKLFETEVSTDMR
ncbi:MAG: hypothetical protein AB8D78_12170 [Akkermansiaceae bacterium]